MNEFEFLRPRTLDEAARAFAQVGDARYLSGGQSLLPSMKLGLSAPERLVDLSGIAGLSEIRGREDAVVVGAAATHASVAASREVAARIPALARLAGGIGDPAVRAVGTLGGSLAHNDPAACYPAAVLGLGATVRTDRREVDADEFFVGMYETALEPGEIVVSVRFPVPRAAAWRKFRQPASRFSLVGVFVSHGPAGVRVAVTGAAPCVFRVAQLESALAARWSPKSCEGVTIPADELSSDLHASAEFRAHLITTLAARAVADAS